MLPLKVYSHSSMVWSQFHIYLRWKTLIWRNSHTFLSKLRYHTLHSMAQNAYASSLNVKKSAMREKLSNKMLTTRWYHTIACRKERLKHVLETSRRHKQSWKDANVVWLRTSQTPIRCKPTKTTAASKLLSTTKFKVKAFHVAQIWNFPIPKRRSSEVLQLYRIIQRPRLTCQLAWTEEEVITLQRSSIRCVILSNRMHTEAQLTLMRTSTKKGQSSKMKSQMSTESRVIQKVWLI